ncbi:MAG: EamA family transporter [Spirochaetia bacterium]|nr:EamA family transporter [Spirochaetia bacterium]
MSYLTLYIVWGSTYLAIRIAVATMPAFYLVGFRYFIAGLGFLILSAATGRLKRRPNLKEILAASFLGFFRACGFGAFLRSACDRPRWR